ncbi:hypothetical protein RFI_10170 [Reticulomyxa filosa]|uniref:Anaphase-promoting complex subunit 1 n=1 Tax=Reticulomyxa filosa TaxID=46433 RepID=X6NM28_RETFI|nr:hypothetical protein RFI_10170 [Reticulomyxa filosa]|eukprot:ETO26963.1 hypothetical protein RFI_10170 [Reticulomyxa filosa]
MKAQVLHLQDKTFEFGCFFFTLLKYVCSFSFSVRLVLWLKYNSSEKCHIMNEFSNETSQEEYLVINNRQVIWRIGNRTIKSFSLPEHSWYESESEQPSLGQQHNQTSKHFDVPMMHKCATIFQTDIPIHSHKSTNAKNNGASNIFIQGMWSLVFVAKRVIDIIACQSGDVHEMSLPCVAKRMWTLPEGILIESEHPPKVRSAPEAVSQDRDNDSDNDNGNGNDIMDPTLFSLLHPLEDLRPVALHMLKHVVHPHSLPTRIDSTPPFQTVSSLHVYCYCLL